MNNVKEMVHKNSKEGVEQDNETKDERITALQARVGTLEKMIATLQAKLEEMDRKLERQDSMQEMEANVQARLEEMQRKLERQDEMQEERKRERRAEVKIDHAPKPQCDTPFRQECKQMEDKYYGIQEDGSQEVKVTSSSE